MREALFSILGARATSERVLDLYAGTGALGLEALSRGAGRVVFVERSKEALAALHANVEALGVRDRVRVVAANVAAAGGALAQRGERFGLVFADPPYADVKDGEAVTRLEAVFVPLLESQGMLILEHASRDPSPEIGGLVRTDARIYGDTTLSFYERTSEPTRV